MFALAQARLASFSRSRNCGTPRIALITQSALWIAVSCFMRIFMTVFCIGLSASFCMLFGGGRGVLGALLKYCLVFFVFFIYFFVFFHFFYFFLLDLIKPNSPRQSWRPRASASLSRPQQAKSAAAMAAAGLCKRQQASASVCKRQQASASVGKSQKATYEWKHSLCIYIDMM